MATATSPALAGITLPATVPGVALLLVARTAVPGVPGGFALDVKTELLSLHLTDQDARAAAEAHARDEHEEGATFAWAPAHPHAPDGPQELFATPPDGEEDGTGYQAHPVSVAIGTSADALGLAQVLEQTADALTTALNQAPPTLPALTEIVERLRSAAHAHNLSIEPIISRAGRIPGDPGQEITDTAIDVGEAFLVTIKRLDALREALVNAEGHDAAGEEPGTKPEQAVGTPAALGLGAPQDRPRPAPALKLGDPVIITDGGRWDGCPAYVMEATSDGFWVILGGEVIGRREVEFDGHMVPTCLFVSSAVPWPAGQPYPAMTASMTWALIRVGWRPEPPTTDPEPVSEHANPLAAVFDPAWLSRPGSERLSREFLDAVRDMYSRLGAFGGHRIVFELLDEIDSQRSQLAELADLRAQVGRVRELHSEIAWRPGYCYCSNAWPCPTIRALNDLGGVPPYSDGDLEGPADAQDTTAGRTTYISGLRKLANLLELSPSLALPDGMDDIDSWAIYIDDDTSPIGQALLYIGAMSERPTVDLATVDGLNGPLTWVDIRGRIDGFHILVRLYADQVCEKSGTGEWIMPEALVDAQAAEQPSDAGEHA